MRRVELLLLAVLLLCPPAASASDVQSGVRTYNRIWTQTAPYLGAAGQPPPHLVITIGGLGPLWTERGGGLAPAIHASPGSLRGLNARDRLTRLVERQGIIHEMAHVYQRSEVYLDTPIAEAGAEGFVKGRGQLILLKRSSRRCQPPPDPWITREQFGSNWGLSPRDIR